MVQSSAPRSLPRHSTNNRNEKERKKKKKYFIPIRQAAINQIRRIIVERATTYSHAEIKRELGLPRQTYLRYFKEASLELTDSFQKLAINQEELLRQIAILRERIAQVWEEIRDLSNNKDLDAKQRDSMVNAKMQSVSLARTLMQIDDEIAFVHAPDGKVTKWYNKYHLNSLYDNESENDDNDRRSPLPEGVE